MPAAYKDRIERLDRIAQLIPVDRSGASFPDAGVLLERLAEDYASVPTPTARRRAMQRDLEELVKAARIEIVNPGGKPLRYRRVGNKPESDPYLWSYARASMRSFIREAVPVRNFDRLWQHVLDGDQGLGLGPDRLRVVSDTQRLLPADVKEDVLAAVLEALARSCQLLGGYRDAKGKLTRPVLHPLALLQRGPRIYLFALKEDETEPVRMYALHRMTSASVVDAPARQCPQFNLQQNIDNGYADFGAGEQIRLELRARGYVADLLRDCPLSTKQRMEDEPEGSSFELRVHAEVPGTGQLLRWLLGFGDKLEVVAPAELRRVVAAQAGKVATLYGAGA